MASSPIGPPSPGTSGNSVWNGSSKSNANQRSAEADAASQATRDANDQISRAQHAVQEAQHDADVMLEHTREGFEQQEQNQTAKNEEAIAKQKLKGYEELRDLKRRQQAELNQV